jgi:hypothetical protein
MAARKVKFYGKKVRSYKAKYGSFAEFTRKLRGKASPKEEDQWMDWDAAVNMLNSWEHVTSELDSRASYRYSRFSSRFRNCKTCRFNEV